MMKCYFLILITVVSSLTHAQISKNAVLAGGQFNYYSDKSENENNNLEVTNGRIAISLGTAFKANKVVGITFGFSPLDHTNYLFGNDTINATYRRLDIGVFFREYKKLVGDLYFFGHIEGYYITAKQTEDFSIAPDDMEGITRGGSFAITPGISYQVFKKLQLELSIPSLFGIQYQITNYEYEDPQSNESRRKQFAVFSNLSNITNLGSLGIGLRLVL